LAFTTIQGSGANDATSFVGTSGVDTITINASTITGSGGVFAGAQQAADTINVLSPSANVIDYTLRGGQGADTLAMLAFTSITDSFANGNENNDTVNIASSFTSTVQGGQGDDTVAFTGLQFQSTVNGNKNADTLTSVGVQGGGLYGGQGSDRLNLNAGNNYQNTTISGDNDNDTIAIAGATSFSGVSVLGGQGNDSINAGTGAALTAFATSTLFGGDGNDTINGTQANLATDIALNISSDAGNDNVTGGGSTDTIRTGEGTDQIFGLIGNDTITGGAGADAITTGANNDRVVQSSGDSVAATTGFSAAGAGGTFAAGATIVFGNGIDQITDFGLAAANTIQQTVSYGAAGATVLQDVTGVAASNVTNLALGNYLLLGTWNAGTNTFTTVATSVAGGNGAVTTGAAPNAALLIQNVSGNLTSAAAFGANTVLLGGAALTNFTSGTTTGVTLSSAIVG